MVAMTINHGEVGESRRGEGKKEEDIVTYGA